MMSEQVMSLFVVRVWAQLRSCGQVEVRAELSDGSLLQLNRTDEDLARMMKRMVDRFPDDRETLSSSLLTGLLKIRAAEQSSDLERKIIEVNKLLNVIINLPQKFSQSEAVLAFFQPSAVDQTLSHGQQDYRTLRQEDETTRHDKGQTITQEEGQTSRPEEGWTMRQKEDCTVLHEKSQILRQEEGQTMRQEGRWTTRQEEGRTIRQEEDRIVQQEEDQAVRQEVEHTSRREEDRILRQEEDLHVFQSLVGLSEIMRSNGFCLANTETILFDPTPPTRTVNQSDDSADRRDDGQSEEAELQMQVGPAHSSLHLHLLLTWTQETDILD